MNKRFYLDTCIWRDYLENRSDRFRPLGEWAFQLLKKMIQEQDIVIISDHLVTELRNIAPSEEHLKNALAIIPPSLRLKYELTVEQFDEARSLSAKTRLHLSDAIHAVIANHCNAIFVSRDKHFQAIGSYVTVKKPEELI